MTEAEMTDDMIDAMRQLAPGLLIIDRLETAPPLASAVDDLVWLLPTGMLDGSTEFRGLPVRHADIPQPILGHLIPEPQTGASEFADPNDPDVIAQILAADTADHGSVREYLIELLVALWAGGADAKYGMTGESDWRYDIYWPMAELGLIPHWRAGYGVDYPVDGAPCDRSRRERADALVVAAIRALAASPDPELSDRGGIVAG